MTSFYESHDYYKQMLGLQEKLRKSEEERIRLEERFKILVQESRNRHDACINRLRMRYIEFLEEQRTRDERNHKLLEALDKVDNSLALMTAKTNRLNVLRKQYETYLRRIYASHSPLRSNINDNDTTSQNEEKYSRRNVSAGRTNFPPEVKNISSSEMPPSTYQLNRPVSSSGYNLVQPAPHIYYENRQQNVQSGLLNRQLNASQSLLQMPSAVRRNNIEQPSFQNLSTPVFQQRQPYCNNNARFDSNNYQLDPNLHVSYASTGPQTNPSSQQIIPRFSEPSTQRLEMVQAGLAISDRINGNTSPYKSLDRVTPRYIDPPVATDSYRQQNTEALLGSLQTRLKSGNEVSSSFRTTPMIVDHNVATTPSMNPSLNPSKYLLQSHLNYSPRTPEYCQKSDVPSYPFRTFEEELTKRPERFTPKLLSSAKASRLGIKQALAGVDEGRATTMTIENELDRYIEKIRKLHRDLDADSLEEVDHEQSTSGDILNVSLSDDEAKVSAEGRPREKVPKEVEKVLALADDLASRTVDLNDAKAPEEEGEDENRSAESIRATQSCRPISEGSPASVSGNREGRAAYAKDRISGDIALRRPELDPHENIEKPRERNFADFGNAALIEQRGQQLPQMADDRVDSAVSPKMTTEQDSKDTVTENSRGKEYEDVHVAEESNLEQYTFDVAEELEPWALDRVEKQIREVELTDIEEESVENESVVGSELSEGNREETEHPKEAGAAKGEVDKVETMNVEEVDSRNAEDRLQPESTEGFEAENDMVEKNATEVSEISTSQCQESEREEGDQASNGSMQQDASAANAGGEGFDERKDNTQKEEYNEVNPAPDVSQGNQEEIATQGQEYGDQNYVMEPEQIQEYAPNTEAEYVGSNEEYNYDQNALYGNDQTQEYQDYGNQEYVEGSTEQYEGYTGEQYDQYANVSEGQYEQDPNAQYPEDMNQQYAYAYDQQYDPNQAYETDVNQPYEYTDTYDPNQAEVAQEQVDRAEQEQSQDNKEMEEEAEKKGTEETLEKLETDQSKDDKVPSENEPKKKDVIKSLLDSDTDSTIERNVSNTESDFDFN